MSTKNSEHFLQVFVISFLHKLQKSGCDFLVWSTPNGGSRNKAEAGRMKLEGMLAGVPDITIMSAGKVHFIEMKSERGVLSEGQKDFIAAAKRYGFGVSVVKASTVGEALEQVSAIMVREFGIDQKGMSHISSDVISTAAKFGGLKS